MDGLTKVYPDTDESLPYWLVGMSDGGWFVHAKDVESAVARAVELARRKGYRIYAEDARYAVGVLHG